MTRARWTEWLQLLLLAVVLTAAPASAQETSATEVLVVAPVVVDGEALFEVRGTSGLPAKKRAGDIAERIVEVARRSKLEFVKIEVRDGEFGPTIYADDTAISVVTTADAKLGNLEVALLAVVQGQVIQSAIQAYRASRSQSGRRSSALQVALWTAPFIGISALLYWLRRRLSRRVEDLLTAKLSNVDKATGQIISSRVLASLAGRFARLVLIAVFLVLLYYYLSAVLSAFAETRSVSRVLIGTITAPAGQIFWAAVGLIPNIVTLLIIVLLTRYLLKVTRLVFENIESGDFKLHNFEPQWIWPTYSIIRWAIVILAIVLAYPYIPGSSSVAFKGVSIILGVMVSLGSNSVISNIVAGIFVIYRRSTKLGDRIKIGDHVGDIFAIKLMETQMISEKNELISIPNAQMLSSDLVNYTSSVDGRGLLVHTTVGIGYEEPRQKIERMLLEAANRTVSLKKKPAPFVLCKELGDYAVSYEINAFFKRGGQLPEILSDLRNNILDVFNEGRVQIMTPSYMADPEVPKIAESGGEAGRIELA